MMRFSKALAAWGRPDFAATLKGEIEQLEVDSLPLQQGLSRSSYALERPFQVMIHHIADQGDNIYVKAGVFYAGMVAGCSCADDPTPIEAQPEYCELAFVIDKRTGDTRVELLRDE